MRPPKNAELGEFAPKPLSRHDAGSSAGFSLDNLIGDDPSPEFLVTLNEQHRHLLDLLQGETLRQVANSRIEGYTVAEIAANLGISQRAVRRKLQIIRTRWTDQLLLKD